MSVVALCAEFDWKPLGQILLDGSGRLAFPKVSAVPGLYRFDVSRMKERLVYIGETDQLSRRFQHYRTPGPSQLTNIRIRALLTETLSAGGSALISVISGEVRVTIDGRLVPSDLRRRAERVLVEHAALRVAHAAGETLLNIER